MRVACVGSRSARVPAAQVSVSKYAASCPDGNGGGEGMADNGSSRCRLFPSAAGTE